MCECHKLLFGSECPFCQYVSDLEREAANRELQEVAVEDLSGNFHPFEGYALR